MSISKQQFAGASKAGSSLISPFEQRIEGTVVPKIPPWLETHHLTMLTVVWCALILAFSYLARGERRWLWGVSMMIVCQYVTDFLDGKVGKYRNTGLVKWGFYMDHLLDYVFLCSVVIGYALILPESSGYHLLLILAIYGGYMVNSFLAFAATEKFHISHLKLGPTEFRVALVIINTLLILYGTARMVKVLPFVAAGSLLGLVVLVYRTQKEIWKIDTERRDNSQ
ncbi:MAG: hypothetical protein H0W76_18700 [Pyrinomonadaceae bacterium]|nr:hypothetical protein [Pyrinomonadaceae bacterium]